MSTHPKPTSPPLPGESRRSFMRAAGAAFTAAALPATAGAAARPPHDLLILQGDRHHYGVEPCRARTRTMYIHMAPLTGDRIDTARAAPGCGDGGTLVGLPMVVHCQGHPRVREIFTRIVQAFWSDLPGKHIKLSVLTQMLLFEAGLAHATPPPMRDIIVAGTLAAIQAAGPRSTPCSRWRRWPASRRAP